ncbi:MAG TPA: sigma factor-like helix-turn-helix DNA-binding protein [Kofleriaceae bacterium]|nr:sigma factor-like helix-turn-helix DNA-binding protein [Kofleriaceae bacterium]
MQKGGTNPPGPDPAAVDRVVAAGAAAYPDVAIAAGMRAFIAARAETALAAPDPEARAADLFLAAACAASDPVALARFDALLPAIVRPALARLGMPPSDDDEVMQRVRVALLAPISGGAPGFAGYSARGELRAYVRAVGVRLALKRREREKPAPASDDTETLALLPAADDSPEIRVLKDRCRADVRAGFAAALASLDPRERTLLRQHYVDGLSIDVLGPLHGVHRSTCARWIEAARAKILRGIRDHLRVHLGLTSAELDSALTLVRSQLDLSLSRHL